VTRPRVSDEQLLTRLARVLEEVDPVPAAVTEAALAALATRPIDVELAELVADSAVDTPEVLLDSASDVRALSFASAALTMELHLRADGATWRCAGSSRARSARSRRKRWPRRESRQRRR
jgi:hypothetical protein